MLLKVEKFIKNLDVYRCRKSPDETIYIHAYMLGNIWSPVRDIIRENPENLVGKTIEVDGLQPMIYSALRAKIVNS